MYWYVPTTTKYILTRDRSGRDSGPQRLSGWRSVTGTGPAGPDCPPGRVVTVTGVTRNFNGHASRAQVAARPRAGMMPGMPQMNDHGVTVAGPVLSTVTQVET